MTVINSTIARNAAVAHVGGGVWARGSVYIANSTVSNNYAEGLGGGVFASGTVAVVKSTIIDNIGPVAANVGAGERLDAFGSIIGPPDTEVTGGQVQPTGRNCQVPTSRSLGYNLVTDASCGLNAGTDIVGAKDPMLAELAQNVASARRVSPRRAAKRWTASRRPTAASPHSAMRTRATSTSRASSRTVSRSPPWTSAASPGRRGPPATGSK